MPADRFRPQPGDRVRLYGEQHDRARRAGTGTALRREQRHAIPGAVVRLDRRVATGEPAPLVRGWLERPLGIGFGGLGDRADV